MTSSQDTREFNTGKPPAGEAGLCVTKASPGMFQRWTGEHFRSYCATPSAAWVTETKSTVQSPQWRWATLAELTAAGIPESEARGMVHKSMLADAPWYPPQQEGFGPWIERERSETPPVENTVVVQCLSDNERLGRFYTVSIHDDTQECRWVWGNIVAYCVKLTATEQAEPTTAEVEATQKPQSPEDFVRDMRADELAMNAGMLERDNREPAEKPPHPVAAMPADDPWHLRMAPWTNRLGGNWGAIE